MLNEKFIKRKVDLILLDVDRLALYKSMRFEDVAKDYVQLNNLERLLEKIVNRAIDINQHLIAKLSKDTEKIRGYESTFDLVANISVFSKNFAGKIAPSAGLRNRLVHEYDDLDEEIVFRSVGDALKLYTKYCDHVLKFLKKNKNNKK